MFRSARQLCARQAGCGMLCPSLRRVKNVTLCCCTFVACKERKVKINKVEFQHFVLCKGGVEGQLLNAESAGQKEGSLQTV